MERIDFCKYWHFRRQDEARSVLLDLPHDAMIHEQRDPASPGGSANAFFPGGRYTYEKHFQVPDTWQDKTVIFLFEGIYRNIQVYINDRLAGGRPYGYLDFTVPAGDLLLPGQENTIRVEVDNSNLPNSRWYTGSGIYRPVYLLLGDKTHIEPDGIQITTLSVDPAVIRVRTEATAGTARVEIRAGAEVVASGTGNDLELTVPSARLWSAETPDLYTCHVDLEVHGQTVDQDNVTFGIRQLSWSNRGFFVNGQSILLRGGCVHHDNGILGACSYEEAEERRVRMIKEAGFNAIRASHNPAARAMLRACDRYGLYVIDETWDMWYIRKNPFDYAIDFPDWYQQDVELLVRRDFNHPSVIMYSIGNELTEPYQPKGQQLTGELADLFRRLDPGRPVTGGINLMIINLASQGKGIYDEEKGGRKDQDKPQKTGSLFFNMITSMVGSNMNNSANSDAADQVTSPCLDALDIAGYNYASGRYPQEGTKHPDRIIYGSETFPQDIAANWAMVQKYPYLIGDFMWAAWDYLGEVGIGGWSYRQADASFEKPFPWLLAQTGVIDILGQPGAEARYAAVVWGLTDQPFIGVRPVNHPGEPVYKSTWRWTNAIDSWSWQGCAGNKAEIEVYSSASQVELFINGRSRGKQKLKDCKALFKARYEPGAVRAVATDHAGHVVGEYELQSATRTVRLQIRPESATVQAGQVVFFRIELVGDNQVIESNADQQLSLTVDSGQLLGFGSAAPYSEERFDTGIYTTYQGRALAVIRAGESGSLTLRVKGQDLAESLLVMPIISNQ
ncbi:MAG TPA: glycoside hydrolase family 2 [Clostridiales bacterium]|nr:glycoside hydrolase family 2 [Clostridiales bacterium]